MASIDDLLNQVSDESLRNRLKVEIAKLKKTKKFGLVFEEHLPEQTTLPEVPIRIGSKVALKKVGLGEIYKVTSLNENDEVTCIDNANKSKVFKLSDLATVAEFGTPIYPYLKRIDAICNNTCSPIWHSLIESDNFHALQLLDYLYQGKVDCIYIDPPYNTGAKDWKYNNNYVDGNDAYRHSKWLSMMKKRLLLAKKLLNPKNSVLIITIDEKEYLHLGCLLEELFPEANLQMISTVINPKGVSSQKGFRRADEYIFFVMLGDSAPAALDLSNEWAPSSIKSNANDKKNNNKKTKKQKNSPEWTSMMRRGSHSSRAERPGLYYAIYADPKSKKIVLVGEPLALNLDKDKDVKGLVQILPIRKNGQQGCWQVGPAELNNRIKQGRVRLGNKTAYGFVVNYLPDGEYKKVLSSDFQIIGYAADGSLIASRQNYSHKWIAPTQWKIASHDSSAYGSTLLSHIFSGKRFAFPKSLYAVHDTLKFFVANKPDALILDFFAGSGTTLHAVNLLNAEDGGTRRCILVTNNEISVDEAKSLSSRGLQPGDDEWEKLGIARFVTWPRTLCSIKGQDIDGKPLKGNYLNCDIQMSDGFKANAIFFKLGFLSKTSVALGQQFKNLLPLLWMKAGAYGPCPDLKGNELPIDLVLPQNHFAILLDEKGFVDFEEKLKLQPSIQTIYLVTDLDFSHYFRWLFANFRECSLIS